MKVVVVGGVAGGMSFAARARRLAEHAEIVVLERDPYVSYANCGLPYHLADEIPDRQSLLLHTPQSLAATLALDVRTGHEVCRGGHRHPHRPRCAGPLDGSTYTEPYDALVLSTGATPVRPPMPGIDLPAGPQSLRTVPDVDRLRALVEGGADRAVVVGAGFIGLEVAEALRHRGLQVHLVELAGQVLPPLDPEMARSVERELTRVGVDVRLGRSVQAVHAAERRRRAWSCPTATTLAADLVLLAIGVRPETSLAKAAGLTLNDRGAVRGRRAPAHLGPLGLRGG